MHSLSFSSEVIRTPEHDKQSKPGNEYYSIVNPYNDYSTTINDLLVYFTLDRSLKFEA
jgi:hypothetical protein